MSTLPPLHSSPPTGGLDGTTRVDSAHAALPTRELRHAPGDPTVDAPSLSLLKAIAGHDPQAAAQQLRGQALELATMLRDKQRLLDQRESELNARAALLESDLRAARLRRFRDEPMQRGSLPEAGTAEPSSAPDTAVSRTPAIPEERMVALDERTSLRDEAPADACSQEPPCESPFGQVNHVNNEPVMELPTDDVEATDSPVVVQRPTLLAATEVASQLEQIEQQRHELRRREEKLERRQRHVEQLHDEVTQLHREALELRLASEQVWADLKTEFPREELSRTLAAVRAKLADNYRLANDMLAQRKDELHQLRADLNLQEQRLRQQRRDLQMWADRRYDEIESRLAKIIVRERELDQLESQLQRQSLQWQQQRQAYRQEIEQLSWQLHERSAC